MKDLKDHVLITRELVICILSVLTIDSESTTDWERGELKKALNQDLSGMVVVPIEPTTEMKAAGASSLEDVVCKYNNTFIRRDYLADDVYKAMLSAAKEKNDD